MNPIRAYILMALLVPLTLFFVGLRLLFWPIARVSRRTDRMLRRYVLRAWGYSFSFAAGLRVIVKGTPAAPPFYMVCNHLSYLDMVILARQTGCIFVSRADVEQWPFFGFVARSFYVLFINRTDRRDVARVNILIEETIAEGDAIAVFPESHTSCGLDINPFRSPLLQPAVTLDIPVNFASIYYRTAANAPAAGILCSWWKPIPFYVHFYRFLQYRGTTVTIQFGEKTIRGTDRKVLAKELEEAVRKNFVPQRQEESDSSQSVTDHAE
ncbi:MAG: 1-acyl-sn-glycerol-3-phosphate acyltransferase [Candidatus Hydrogenedentes bacterium]|nr:1-acyl-sn-glycerol-3-phosphate acyltransferase [Candidatus Hydrogenedentota bacterium]